MSQIPEHINDDCSVEKLKSSLVELKPTSDLAALQRQSPDLSAIIAYLENGILPDSTQAATRIVCDADNWYLDTNSVLYHLHNSRRRNVNSALGH